MLRVSGRFTKFAVLGLATTVLSFGQLGRTAEKVAISDAALELHQKSLVFDAHNNLVMQLRKQSLSAESVDLQQDQKTWHTDIPRLKLGGVGAEFFATFVSADAVKKGIAVRETLEQIEQLSKLFQRNADSMEWAGQASDVERLHQAGKVASLIAVEGGNAIQSSLPVLRAYHQAGARCMALTHDDTTEWADAALDKATHKGLAKFGEQVVAEMNRLGMLIDLSHSSEETVKDVLAITKAPVIFSHSAAYKLAPHPRNVSDDVLRLVAENGGVVQINFFAGFLTADTVKAYDKRTKAAAELRKSFKTDEQFKIALTAWLKEHPLPTTSAKDVVNHIDHIVKVAGIDHVGLGSSFDGIVSVPQDLQDVSCFPCLTQEMLDRGYLPEKIQKVLGGNTLRVLREVAGGSTPTQDATPEVTAPTTAASGGE